MADSRFTGPFGPPDGEYMKCTTPEPGDWVVLFVTSNLVGVLGAVSFPSEQDALRFLAHEGADCSPAFPTQIGETTAALEALQPPDDQALEEELTHLAGVDSFSEDRRSRWESSQHKQYLLGTCMVREGSGPGPSGRVPVIINAKAWSFLWGRQRPVGR